MNINSVQQMTGRVAQLMEQRLGAKGSGLRAKLAARGRALPRQVRRAVSYLAEVEAVVASPKIARQTDPDKITAAYDIAVRYLQPLGGQARFWSMVRTMVASVAFALLVTGAAVICVMVWRGIL
ncbi:hypothetical protein [Phaeovulum sp.]|uniref:hypothetical protein n=1 Tax=Phaeovulum sp. TaxID=2934796 RepID=UPI0039E59DCD